MAFQLSPGVNVTEKDLTLIVPAVATTPAGIVGPFQWGPGNERTLITSETNLIKMFGGPLSSLDSGISEDYATYWFSASNFLSYGTNLTIVRALSNLYHTASNVYSTGETDSEGEDITTSGIPVSDESGFWKGIFSEISFREFMEGNSNTTIKFSARYAGSLGNSLKVVVLDSGVDFEQSTDAVLVEYSKLFDSAPGTSLYLESITGSTEVNDEIHVLVIDEKGLFSGTKGTVLEKFEFLSKALDAKLPDGTNNYWMNKINNESQYIHAINAPVLETSSTKLGWGESVLSLDDTKTSFKLISDTDKYEEFTLSGGSLEGSGSWDQISGSTLDGNIIEFYQNNFGDAETTDVSLLIAGPVSGSAAKQIVQIAESRKDCIAFISPKPQSGSLETLSLEDVTKYFGTDVNYPSSYGVADSGYKLQYDRFNDVYRYVPLCADVAGCCVTTDLNRDPWFSPAGFDRGRIKNVIRLAFNPNKTERDELYRRGINPVVSFQGEGTVLYGDKTMLRRPSAFDRINVRRLFIVLEKAIATASKFLLFEFNDDFTRAQFRNLVEPYLREVQGRRGITDFRVVCDETNNTPQVIDSNSFVGDIYIKPNRSINFIQLNFVATPTGVSFSEVQGA